MACKMDKTPHVILTTPKEHTRLSSPKGRLRRVHGLEGGRVAPLLHEEVVQRDGGEAVLARTQVADVLRDEADDDERERDDHHEHERQLRPQALDERAVQRHADEVRAVGAAVALEALARAVLAVAVARAAVRALDRAVGAAVARLERRTPRHVR